MKTPPMAGELKARSTRICNETFKKTAGTSKLLLQTRIWEIAVCKPSDHWPLVLKALEDPRWKFRTISSISRETGLSVEDVKIQLKMHGELIYQAVHPDKFGQTLYTTTKRAPRVREFIGNLQRYVGKTPLYAKRH